MKGFENILIIGAGDHAKIVIDILRSNEQYHGLEITGLVDILNKHENIGNKILNSVEIGRELCDVIIGESNECL